MLNQQTIDKLKELKLHFSGGVDRIHLAAATGSTLGSKSRPGDRDEVDPRRSQ